MELERHPFELRTCIEEALDLLAPKATEKKLDIAYIVDEVVPVKVLGDVTRLRQIIVNLAGNAVKFTPEGEVVIHVGKMTTEPHKAGALLLHFSVRDTGIGIPADKQDRLFKLFSQVDSSTTRHYGGTGLGLAISKRLAELMGGRMWVESEEGQGATFHFTIEVEDGGYPEPELTLPQLQLKDKRLLVVEHNATNRQILTQQARKWGLQAVAVATGDEALARLSAGETFDLAAVDLQLGPTEGVGYELVKSIRQLPQGGKLPIALLSSTRLRAGDAAAAHLHISVSVHKPIRRAQLLDALSRTLAGWHHVKKAPAVPQLDEMLAAKVPARILLADDNPVNLKVAQAYLNKMGYRPESVTNGLEVLHLLEHRMFDFIFIDVQMPEMDGYETARQIRQRWSDAERPRLIAITGNAMQGDREKCLTAGMDDYISKPVRAKELEAVLYRWGQRTG
jgi:CheY-like chemotaxis protein